MKHKLIPLLLVMVLCSSMSSNQAYSEYALNKDGEMDPISVVSLSYDGAEYGYHDFSAIVKNNTESIVNSIDLAFILLDEANDIVKVAYAQENARVRPGQSISLSAMASEDINATSFNVDFYGYVDDNGQYLSGFFNHVIQNAPFGDHKDTQQLETDQIGYNADHSEPISVESLSYDGFEFGYHDYSVKLRNNTDSTIHTPSVTFVLFDDNGTIINTSYGQEPVRVKPGQAIWLSGIESEETKAASFNVDSYSFINANNEFQEHYFNTIPKNMSLSNTMMTTEGDIYASNSTPTAENEQSEYGVESDNLYHEKSKTSLTDSEKVDAMVYLISLEDEFGDNITDDEYDELLEIVAEAYGVTSDEIFLLNGDVDVLKKAYSKLYKPSSTPEITQYDATLEYGDGMVLVFVSEEAMERYMTALNNGRQGTQYEMFLNGEVGYTLKGTKCNIVSTRMARAQVKLLEGAYSGSTVWVIIESIHENK